MLRISRDGFQGFGRGLEENVIDHLLVLVGDGSNLFRHGKYDVKIRAVEKLRLTLLDPMRPSETLAFRAVSISAAIECVPFIGALITALEVTAKCRGAAHLDCSHDASLCRGHRRVVLLAISCAVAAEDIRHFQLWAIHEPAVQKY
jgi:hypothetical protein